MSQPTLGLDVSKATLDAVLLSEDQSLHRSVPNTPAGWQQLQTWLEAHHVSTLHACLEATGRYGEGIALFLYTAGYTVSVINPAAFHAFAKARLARTKTDKTDALLLAHFCVQLHPAPWAPPAPEVRELQELTRYLDTLLQSRTRLLNRQKSGLSSPLVLASLERQLAALQEEIRTMEQAIQALLSQSPLLSSQVDLLTSAPGVAWKTAAIILAEIPDISLFSSPAALSAFLGLSPHHRLSGTSVHGKASISKIGSSRFRKAFFFPACSAMRHNPALRTFAQRLQAQGKPKMVIIVAVMRKLVHLLYALLTSGIPFDPSLGVSPS